VTPTVVEVPVAGPLRDWADDLVAASWGGAVARRGALVDPAACPGFVAVDGERPVGLVTFAIRSGDCEIVTIDARVRRAGVGRRLVAAVIEMARAAGVTSLWLITTNDNRVAIAFYEALGFVLVARYDGAVDEARRTIKPGIPATGVDGTPIRDELEYRLAL
jgi:ribosomal protein S18 acetylase RimI-like enzyme